MTIVEIQNALLARGYDIGEAGADGDVGPATIAAVMSFQRSAGLVADGIAGPLTQLALASADANPLKAEAQLPAWLILAEGEIGTVEGIGKANNPKVIAYFRDSGFAGVKDDEVAWCAAFVGAMLDRSGIKPSGSLAARSYERWGVGLREPLLGCVGTKRRNNSSWQGHVGFVVGANASKIFMLGGNQGDRVSIDAFPRSEFTSYRWPSTVPLMRSTTLPKNIADARTNVSEA